VSLETENLNSLNIFKKTKNTVIMEKD